MGIKKRKVRDKGGSEGEKKNKKEKAKAGDLFHL